jgi:hypothetical protein
MSRDILFETSRFNLTEVKPHFINDCCFGEDLARWLREMLIAVGMTVIEPAQEDWGWYIEASHDGQSYFIGIGGNAEEGAADTNQGQWRISIEKHRSLKQKLTGKNKMTADEPIIPIIRGLLEREPDVSNIVEE